LDREELGKSKRARIGTTWIKKSLKKVKEHWWEVNVAKLPSLMKLSYQT
jgi:hypothetical protein